MYRWVVLLHVLSALAFMAAHGTSIAATFRLKKVDAPDEARAILALSQYVMNFMYASLGLVLLTGIVAALWIGWWKFGWFWASLVILVGIAFSMVPLAMAPFHRMRYAVGLPYMGSPPGTSRKPQPAAGIDLAAMHSAAAELRPAVLTAIAGIGVALLVWLMMFKPF